MNSTTERENDVAKSLVAAATAAAAKHKSEDGDKSEEGDKSANGKCHSNLEESPDATPEQSHEQSHTSNDSFEFIESNRCYITDVRIFRIMDHLRDKDSLGLKTRAFSKGGFINDALRHKVWSMLTKSSEVNLPKLTDKQIEEHDQYRQVVLDVDRSLQRFPPSVHEHKRAAYQEQLTKLIVQVLHYNPELNYYQGYHDICLTILLLMDEDEAFRIINQISLTHLCIFMQPTMEATSNLLEIVYLILKKDSPSLYKHLMCAEVGTIFCLPWVITWFSHVLKDFDEITRLFDFFISSHFLMPIYLTTSMLLQRKEDILRIEPEMSTMHRYLCDIPLKHTMRWDTLIYRSLQLSMKHPPEELIEEQAEIRRLALKDQFDSSPKLSLVNRANQLLRNNIYTLAFVVLIGGVGYQLLFAKYS